MVEQCLARHTERENKRFGNKREPQVSTCPHWLQMFAYHVPLDIASCPVIKCLWCPPFTQTPVATFFGVHDQHVITDRGKVPSSVCDGVSQCPYSL